MYLFPIFGIESMLLVSTMSVFRQFVSILVLFSSLINFHLEVYYGFATLYEIYQIKILWQIFVMGLLYSSESTTFCQIVLNIFMYYQYMSKSVRPCVYFRCESAKPNLFASM